MQEINIKPGVTNYSIVLIQSTAKLSEVVVTALGIERKRGNLGYSYDLAGAVPGVQVTSGNYQHYEPKLDREGYGYITENRFLKVTDNPLSTFSIDVDAASYSNIRRWIKQNQLPPAGAVRVEEMINYFKYNYSKPNGEHPFSVNTEVAICPWNTDHQLVLVGLQGKEIPVDNLPASNLVFLIDVSGSMSDENKLPLVKASLKMLTEQLREQDKVSIVVYAGNAGLVLTPTSGANKSKIIESLDRLEAGGSTAGGQGIQLAYRVAQEQFIKGGNNRVILCTDGDFNVGASSDDELVRMIEQKRESGVYLTVLGYGTGNYQDSKMQQLADKGNGNHAYIDQLSEAKKVLVNEFGGTLFTIAKDVKLQVEFNPAVVQGYRLIGYENRLLNKEDFNNDKKDAGEMGSGHSVTAIYEVIPQGVSTNLLDSVDALKYQKKVKQVRTSGEEMMTVKIRYKNPESDKSILFDQVIKQSDKTILQVSENLRWAAAVAEFGMLLRGSEFVQSGSYDQVLELARTSSTFDKEGYKKEMISLVYLASSMASNDKKRESKSLASH
ncbi:MAG: VWA domain-containing protein [Chitinophagaceae bacterium]|nr:VWA domain-containing protein [Chitinophagaceae bacterium]